MQQYETEAQYKQKKNNEKGYMIFVHMVDLLFTS